MNKLKQRAISQTKTLLDSARSATYSHQWPKNIAEAIDLVPGLKVRLDDYLNQHVAAKIQDAEGWLDDLVSADPDAKP